MIMDSLEHIDTFRAQWPFAARYVRVNGWRMHYVDEGSGDPILLLHGNPTWGFLYRRVIPPLVDAGHRVIVPDMIGFGLSEKPAREQAHSLDGHIANLAGLVRQLDLRRVTVVCHDWGGPTGLGFAMSNLERGRALTVMSTWAGFVTETVAGQSSAAKMVHDDLVCPPSVPACDYPARRLVICAFHAQLSRRRRSACGARTGYLLRNGAAMGIEVRAVVRPRTSPSTPAANIALASR
jgi:pimeloyl-ACP methyl ester carboxylesterase